MTVSRLLPSLFGILAHFALVSVALESIIHGDKTEEHQFPYHVGILTDGNGFECGGGIIDEKFILTAAHCMLEDDYEIRNKGTIIIAGTNDRQTPGNKHVVTRRVVKVYVSKDFHFDKDSFGDIAVLKLNEPLGLSHHQHLQKLELPEVDKTFAGKTGVIAAFGWSWIVLRNNRVVAAGVNDTKLRYAKAAILHNQQCQRYYKSMTIQKSHMCGIIEQRDPHKPRGMCVGDSGSPLVVDKKIVVGVVSKSAATCMDAVKPGIYTRVTSYLKFIHDAMNDKHSHNILTLELPH